MSWESLCIWKSKGWNSSFALVWCGQKNPNKEDAKIILGNDRHRFPVDISRLIFALMPRGLNIRRGNVPLFRDNACPSYAYVPHEVEHTSIRNFGPTDFRPARVVLAKKRNLLLSFANALTHCRLAKPKATKCHTSIAAVRWRLNFEIVQTPSGSGEPICLRRSQGLHWTVALDLQHPNYSFRSRSLSDRKAVEL
jgi:hypothetical protein